MTDQIRTFIDDQSLLDPKVGQRIDTLHEQILSVLNDSGASYDKGIKYGGIIYHVSGQIIGGIYSYKSHISIEFSQGVQLSDPGALLQGSGKLRRHLRINHDDDCNTDAVTMYVKQAIQIATSSE